MQREMEVIISVVLLIIGISILVFIHFCVVGRAFRSDRNNGRDLVTSRVERIQSMRREDIEELPCFEYKVEEGQKRGGDCAVCLENFKEGEKCRVLPQCNHSFHVACIDTWLLKTAACPICRTDATSLKVEECSDFSGEGVAVMHSSESILPTGNEGVVLNIDSLILS